MGLVKTEFDETNEAATAYVISELGYDARLADLEQKGAAYDIIISLEDGTPVAYAEVKTRAIRSDDYAETLIPVKKIARLLELAQEANVAPLVIFNYHDTSLWIDARDIDADRFRIGTAVRRKPRPSGVWLKSDKGHPAYYIPILDLKPIEALKEYLNVEA